MKISSQNLLHGTKTSGLKDLLMLKVITGSGLYPQVAVADDFNHAKVSRIFFSRGKIANNYAYFLNM